MALPALALSLSSVLTPSARAADGNTIIFSYMQGEVTQTVENLTLSGKSSVILTVSAAEFQDWKAATDLLQLTIYMYNNAGETVHTAISQEWQIDSTTFANYSLAVNSSDVSGWNDVTKITVSITGKDGEWWAGNYGTVIESASLKLDNTEVLTNREFIDSIGWNSSLGWQTCSGGAGGQPCISLAPVVVPTSIVVTSLADDGSAGTLRWAIAQANASQGGINDTITFASDLSGTISLLSALPTITDALTITGNGQSVTIIDGNALYRPFNVASGKSLTISNLTLKRGQNVNGGLIYNNVGTVNATNVRFTSMTGGSAVFNNNGGSVANYTDCTFDYLTIGIAGDYGSTPQLAAGVTSWSTIADTVFGNRTYVTRGTFANNAYGIRNYRFTKIINSVFDNNSYGAHVTGLNRTQILGSTFNNNGIGIYHNAWIPSSFNMGTDNRYIANNIFTNNGTSIYLDDGYSNGNKYQGWSTLTGNSWDENGTWVVYYSWSATSSANVGGTASIYSTSTQWTQDNNVSSTTTTTTTTTLPPTTTTTPVRIVPSTTTTTEAPVATTTTASSVPVQTTVLQQTEQPQATTTTSTVPVTTTTTTTLPPEEKAPVPPADEIEKIEDPKELSALIASVDLENIKPDQAVALITNAVFTELPKEDLKEVFETLPVSELSVEQEAQLVTALTSAPEEVKNTFEAAVDIYGSGLDEYIPVGSEVPVKTRRALIAVTTVMSATAASGAAPGGSGGTGSGGNGGGSSPSDQNKAARKEDEQEDEEAGGLEGPEDREKNTNTRNSIFTYGENNMKKFSIIGFIKKFAKETAALSFTFAGSAIMFVTLSGDTRRIAIIATAAAVLVHYVHVMLENDEE